MHDDHPLVLRLHSIVRQLAPLDESRLGLQLDGRGPDDFAERGGDETGVFIFGGDQSEPQPQVSEQDLGAGEEELVFLEEAEIAAAVEAVDELHGLELLDAEVGPA